MTTLWVTRGLPAGGKTEWGGKVSVLAYVVIELIFYDR